MDVETTNLVHYQPGSDLLSAIGVQFLRLESSNRITERLDGSRLSEPGYVVLNAIDAGGKPRWASRNSVAKHVLISGHVNALSRLSGTHLNFNQVTPEMVQAMIATKRTGRLDEKTTIVSVTLVNGFVIHETASCVDPANYSQEIGERICLERIEKKVWEFLGFLLQTARFGFRHVEKAEEPAEMAVNGCCAAPSNTESTARPEDQPFGGRV